jgi:hypothetical protein
MVQFAQLPDWMGFIFEWGPSKSSCYLRARMLHVGTTVILLSSSFNFFQTEVEGHTAPKLSFISFPVVALSALIVLLLNQLIFLRFKIVEGEIDMVTLQG